MVNKHFHCQRFIIHGYNLVHLLPFCRRLPLKLPSLLPPFIILKKIIYLLETILILVKSMEGYRFSFTILLEFVIYFSERRGSHYHVKPKPQQIKQHMFKFLWRLFIYVSPYCIGQSRNCITLAACNACPVIY